MSTQGVLQLLLYFALLTALAVPLGAYVARVYEGRPVLLERALGPLERGLYRLAGVRKDQEQTWKQYALALVVFTVVSIALVFVVQRTQSLHPWNPQKLGAPSADLSLNTATSFATNTNWQAYGGESTLSYFTQMVALTAQNFVSAAAGMAVLAALIRAMARKTTDTIGSFWVDLTRGTLYVLLPLSIVLALFLVSQGVVQTLSPYATVDLVQPFEHGGKAVTEQVIALGPAASQIAIKQLGTNGGGFFNANSAHPLENPTPLTNFVEMLSILLVPAALCFTFGRMVKDERQGWAVFAAMNAVFFPLVVLCVWAEQQPNPLFAGLHVDQALSALQSGGHMEGKEVRFGIGASATWASATTAASNGSVNAMHDSFSPLGGMVPLWLMQLGEIIYGGVGSGLYGMLMMAIVTVFVAGLMVGRTPEYLGKKIEAFEMKMAALTILLPNAATLIFTALCLLVPSGRSSVFNDGPHGFSEVLYAFSSQANNNGSAFGGLAANTPLYNVTGTIAMLVGRFGVAVPVLAIAGALAKKKLAAAGAGTLPTHTPLFVAMLVGVIVVVGALTHIPGLALGPIVEHLSLHGH